MVTADERSQKISLLEPLSVTTNFFEDESITSWLIRASFNQGCSPSVFTQYYWPDYRIWTYDVDKGFYFVNHRIHEDMAILANTEIDRFDNQTLISFTKTLNKKIERNSSLLWTNPLSKRNRYARIGYYYCPDCMEEDKQAYLRLKWRFTWSVCCTKHRKFLQVKCPHCNHPYQPQLINPEQRFINYCHFCCYKLDDRGLHIEPNEAAYRFQLLSDQVCHVKQGVVLGKIVSIADWFDYLLFLINLTRIALKNNNHMFGKLLTKLGINLEYMSFPKTGLRFDFLPLEERVILLECSYYLSQVVPNDWLGCCKELGITQNSFQWSKNTVTPKAFSQVYDQLPKVQTRKHIKRSENTHPTSPEAVMTAWHRLKRKIDIREAYDKHLKKN